MPLTASDSSAACRFKCNPLAGEGRAGGKWRVQVGIFRFVFRPENEKPASRGIGGRVCECLPLNYLASISAAAWSDRAVFCISQSLSSMVRLRFSRLATIWIRMASGACSSNHLSPFFPPIWIVHLRSSRSQWLDDPSNETKTVVSALFGETILRKSASRRTAPVSTKGQATKGCMSGSPSNG